MKHKYFSKFVTAIFLLLLVLSSFANVLACNCYIPSVCTAYSRAKKVFIGKLDKVVHEKDGLNVTTHFSVEKTYKGKTDSSETIIFKMGMCGELDFIIGEKYFVYAERANINTYCNRTDILSSSKRELDYANSLSETNPIFTIGGRIEQLSDDELKNTEVWVEEGQNKYQIPVEKYGFFNYKVKEKGLYHITVILPFDAEIQMTSGNIGYSVGRALKVTNSDKQTIIEYDLQFEPNSCDEREISFNKDYKIALSKISGKIIDESGNPITNLFVYLFPNTPNQNFQNWDYKVGKTNQAGEYDIDKLKPGSYILGINMGRTPKEDIPYPETYFPGKETISESQIITLTEGQDLMLKPFVLPPKLKTVKVFGKIVWEDGTPAAKLPTDNSPLVNPRVYLIDPITLKSDLGGLIVTDKQGNFSFLGYEGYSYILHADGINSENQSMHSKHVLIKVVENTPSITLKLNLKGEGRNAEDIKKELDIK